MNSPPWDAEHARFAQLDAAYALGALEPAERVGFERHLAGCGACRARVGEAVETLTALSVLRDADAVAGGVPAALSEPAEPVPDTVLPRLLAAAGRERRRRTTRTVAGALAVAAGVAVLVGVWVGRSTGPGAGPTTQPVAAQSFLPVRPSPVHANATLVRTTWGTRIDVHCSYATGVTEPYDYRLRVVDDAGDADDLGSWQLPVRGDISYVAGTSVDLDDIRSVQIVRTDGTPILELRR